MKPHKHDPDKHVHSDNLCAHVHYLCYISQQYWIGASLVTIFQHNPKPLLIYRTLFIKFINVFGVNMSLYTNLSKLYLLFAAGQ